jgi:uncharacterized protein
LKTLFLEDLVRLTPRENSFFPMFVNQAHLIMVGADILARLIDAVPADRPDLARRLREVEHEADEQAHTIYDKINTSFVTPFDREDIYRLASRLDDVMDAMEAAGDLIVLYGVEKLPSGIHDQAALIQRAAQHCADAMPKLKDMKDLMQYWVVANELEGQADRTYRRLVAELFSGAYETLDVLKLKDIVDNLEEASDALEAVANMVETIAVKGS